MPSDEKWDGQRETLDDLSKANHYNNWIYQILRPYLGKRILEIGCGTGNLTGYFQKHGTVLAVDFHAGYLEIAKKNLTGISRVTFKKIDLEKNFSFMHSFRPDTLVCVNVLEHLSKDQQVLEKCFSLLPPKGKLLVFVPAFQFLFGTMDQSYGHFRRYSMSDLKNKMETAGFQLEYCRYLNLLGVFGWWINGKIFKKKIIPKSQILIYDKVVRFSSKIEKYLPKPLGLSLFYAGQKPLNPIPAKLKSFSFTDRQPILYSKGLSAFGNNPRMEGTMDFQKPRSLSIIVPVYNEEKTLLLLLKKVQAVKLLGLKKQIIIVNDGSTDNTSQVIQNLKMPNVLIFQHEHNRGKGSAIRTAIPHTTGDIVIIQDADLEYDPSDYKAVLGPLLDGSADVVYGSRFKGIHRAFLFWHYVGNKFLTFLTNILYDTVLTDMETCYKAFRGEIIRSIPLRSNRFDFEPEVTAKILKRGYKLFEVPISFRGRGFLEGKKITWKDGFVALYCLIRYRFMD